MHVGLVIYGSLDTVSGGYLYDRQLVHSLREEGHKVEIISLPWSSYGRHILHNFRPSLLQRFRRGHYDILLQDELNHPSLYLVNEQLKRQSNTSIVSIVHHLRTSEHHPPERQARYRRIERRYLRSVNGFIYNSRTTRKATEALSGRALPYVIAYPAADHVQGRPNIDQIKKRAVTGRPLHLLFVGNVIPRKGLHTLLAALVRLPVGSWTLSVAGDLTVDADYANRLRELVAASALSANIHWHGRLPDVKLWEMMANHDLLVIPSSYEGFGIAYLEGMAFGLPAIATTAGAAAELITDGENGYLISPGDVKALAGRINQLQQNRRLLSRLSVSAQERFLTAPTWRQSMSAAQKFLLQMCP